MPALEISVFPPSRTYSDPSRRALVAIAVTSDPAPGSVIANAVITFPSAIGPSQRSFCAGEPPSRIGVVPRPWSANTASASGDASPSASRIRQQPRRSRSKIGCSHPPAPSSPSSVRASPRAAASSGGSARPAISAAVKPRARSASAPCRGSRNVRISLVSGMAYSNLGSRLARNAS